MTNTRLIATLASMAQARIRKIWSSENRTSRWTPIIAAKMIAIERRSVPLGSTDQSVDPMISTCKATTNGALLIVRQTMYQLPFSEISVPAASARNTTATIDDSPARISPRIG